MWTHVCRSFIHSLLIEDLLSAKGFKDAGDGARCQSQGSSWIYSLLFPCCVLVTGITSAGYTFPWGQP